MRVNKKQQKDANQESGSISDSSIVRKNRASITKN